MFVDCDLPIAGLNSNGSLSFLRMWISEMLDFSFGTAMPQPGIGKSGET